MKKQLGSEASRWQGIYFLPELEDTFLELLLLWLSFSEKIFSDQWLGFALSPDKAGVWICLDFPHS